MLNSMKLFGTWKTRVSQDYTSRWARSYLVVAACAFAGMSAPQFSNDQGGSACSDLPGMPRLKERSRCSYGCGNQRFKQPDVGDYRQSRRCGLRRRLLRCEPRRPVARQPGHLCPEGQHRQCLQP